MRARARWQKPAQVAPQRGAVVAAVGDHLARARPGPAGPPRRPGDPHRLQHPAVVRPLPPCARRGREQRRRHRPLRVRQQPGTWCRTSSHAPRPLQPACRFGIASRLGAWRNSPEGQLVHFLWTLLQSHPRPTADQLRERADVAAERLGTKPAMVRNSRLGRSALGTGASLCAADPTVTVHTVCVSSRFTPQVGRRRGPAITASPCVVY